MTVLAIGTALVAGAFAASSASATVDQEPVPVPGNPSCEDLGFPNEFKIDAGEGDFPEAGEYQVGDPGTEAKGDTTGFLVEFGYTDDDPLTIEFETAIPVNAVLVKAGPGANLFEFDPPTTEGTDLESPKDDSISHITFCWGDDDGEPTTTTSTTTSTTTTTTVPGVPVPDDEAPVPTPSPAPLPAVPVTGLPDFTG